MSARQPQANGPISSAECVTKRPSSPALPPVPQPLPGPPSPPPPAHLPQTHILPRRTRVHRYSLFTESLKAVEPQGREAKGVFRTMPAAAPTVKQTVEVGKPGEYKITIGESLRRHADASSDDDAASSGDVFTSVKYNYKPNTALSNPIPPQLTKHAPTGPAPYTLSLPGAAAKAITYTGSQHVHPPRKAECILLFDHTTQSFTLEKLTSTFTFNAKVYAPAHPALPLRPPIPDGEETDEEEREEDNPFDYRHFINKKPTTKSRAEQKKEREQRRKEALKRAGKDVPEDEPEEEDDEEDLGLGISYNGRPAVSGKGFLASPAIGPRRNVGGKSPFAGKKPVGMSPGVRLPSPGRESESDEDESEEADDEEEDDEEMAAPPLIPPPPAPKRKAPVQRKKAAAAALVVEEPEELVFPELMAIDEPSEEEISDVDESDEDAPPPLQKQQAPLVVEEEEDDEEDDLAKLLEKELGDGDGDEIIFDDDGEVRGGGAATESGWGAESTSAATGGGPISIAGMMGADDDSETSEEE
ncbi:uncharacterized protein H6S33_002221 [Morchella sextelata]|uniref:uncharacterized protein n=1 Tax=Morchella sextelata TaxID=1174677 RepID=UPI001D059665|nr:uncharacterized protein H6S33_002221 [Morchella sextelata]KAH0608169.1 hypothetical protein H6S33_002221 [Morchella sextelata]